AGSYRYRDRDGTPWLAVGGGGPASSQTCASTRSSGTAAGSAGAEGAGTASSISNMYLTIIGSGDKTGAQISLGRGPARLPPGAAGPGSSAMSGYPFRGDDRGWPDPPPGRLITRRDHERHGPAGDARGPEFVPVGIGLAAGRHVEDEDHLVAR